MVEIVVRYPTSPPSERRQTVMPVRRLEEFLALLPDDCFIGKEFAIYGPNTKGAMAPLGHINLETYILRWYGNHRTAKRLPTERTDVDYNLQIMEEP